ncbi:MAG: hypothetical protein KatS3mg115_1944 [Candidatus Poribacteria bacterium]|nr:MAG: hypothetical protein KatS3mg115_1944 [Candidatus Poribacteria bacterium]
MEILGPILRLARLAIELYSWLILLSVLLSWFTIGGGGHPSVHRFQELLHRLTDPFLAPIRALLMPLTMRIGLDFSPMVGFFILHAIASFLPS